MDWKNVDLKSNYERSQNILDPLNFDTLLLEISCNLRDINKETIKKQFLTTLESKINSAKEVFKNNLDNILAEALEYRSID
jgi:hypothetical protein